jgi:predicted phage terminase large subunit-like protein
MDELPALAPGSLPQEQFLLSTSDITLYAGSAGAGKTFAIILNIIKFLLQQNSTIVVFRRTTTELRSGGGIWRDASKLIKLYFGSSVQIRDRDMEIIFPAYNSICKFSHLQHTSDVDKHLSAQYSAIFFDEATTFDPFEEFILPLYGRLRSAGVDYNPQMFLGTNPKFNHGIYHWIKDFYLDLDGIPYADKSNIERYFVMDGGNTLWYDRLEDAEAAHGSGEDSGINSFRSIRAHISDNLILLKKNPGYVSKLKAMSPIKRRIYLDGSWTAREEEAGLYKREWSRVVRFPDLKAKRRVRAWDLASMPVSSATPNPDWTRGILVSKGESKYTIEDLVSIRDRPYVVEELILDTALRDKEQFGDVTVSYPRDPGQAGVARAHDMVKKLAEIGVKCVVKPSQISKRVRFAPVSAIAEAGFLEVMEAEWNEECYVELEEFTGLVKRERDDIVDALSDAFYELNTGAEYPSSIILPDFSKGAAPNIAMVDSLPVGLTDKITPIN